MRRNEGTDGPSQALSFIASNIQGKDMKITTLLATMAGFAALAACGGEADENLATNVDDNLMMEDNLVLPPDDMNMDMNMGNDMNMVDNVGDNMMDNTTDNTVNAY